VRLLCKLSGYSAYKINGIKNYWLGQFPEEIIDYSKIQYMIYDATYFHKDGCLLNLMSASDQKIVAHTYVQKESFKDAYPWFINLRRQGLNPVFITTDGERSVIRAMKLVWPGAKLQRCLYHLQHEGMRWLRTYPKTEAGKELRTILSKLSRIKTTQERDVFIQTYTNWVNKYERFVLSLPRADVAAKDLCRAMVLMRNALPDMFHYLTNSNVHSTTNALEGYHSRLKADYRRHRGLTKEHRVQYIRWYCYYHNGTKYQLF
jgi:transposase-like protein